MGEHHVYRDNSYDLGNHLLILRTRIALTQIALAAAIGVHRRSVQKWETGLAYPKAELLQRLIAVFLRHHAFAPGNERAEALALWEQAAHDGPHPLPAFDEGWFARTLALQSASPLVPAQEADREREQSSRATPADATRPATSHTIIDWGEAIAVPTLYGRDSELATLHQWLLDDRCRVIAILGLGGMGKSSLAITLAHQVVSQFEVLLFRSVQNGPPVAEVLDQAIHAISDQQATPPDQVPGKIALLIQLLRQRRCLLILDNFESLMQPNVVTGAYRTGYAEYGELLRALSEREHQSCLLLTSREKPAELAPLEGRTAPVRTLQLSGLDDHASRVILQAKDIVGTAVDVGALARLYGGNPLALQLIAEPIRELFGGDVGAFLAAGDAFFNGVGQLLAQQFGRSTALEQAILNWLAIERELVPFSALRADLGEAVPQRAVLAALESLRRRLLIERGPDRPTFTLQPVILEYVTDQLVEAVYHEIVNGQVALLCSHALIKAQAKDYVRQSQERLIGQSLLGQLRAMGGAEGAQERLLGLLDGWRGQAERAQGYGPGNVVNLLRLLRGDLRGLDLSHLAIRQAYLAEVEVQEASLAGTRLADAVLAEAFDWPSSVALSEDGALLAVGTSTGTVCLWRVADRTPLWTVQGSPGVVWGVALSARGELLACVGADGTVRLWDAATGRYRATLPGHSGRGWGIALSTDGQLLASGGEDGTVRLWETGTGRPLATFEGHIGGVRGVALSADGQLLASGGTDGTLRVWEAGTGRPLATLQGHTGEVSGVALSADGQLVASGGAEGTVRLWETGSGQLVATMQGHTGAIRGVALSADGQRLASGSTDGTVRLWETGTGRLQLTLPEHTSAVLGVALSADGRLLASGGAEGTVRLWDTGTGRPLTILQGHTGSIWAVALSGDGRLLASGGTDGTTRLWDATTGRLQTTLPAHAGGIRGVALSTDGRLVVSGGVDGTVRLCEAATGRLLATGTGHTRGGVFCVALSADARLLASGGEDGTVRLWDAITGRPLSIMPGGTGRIRGVALSADGRLLASGGTDGIVRLWDTGTGQPEATLSGHRGTVQGVALSADGRLLASGNSDGTVQLWDVGTRQPQATLPGHTGGACGVVLSTDGRLLVSGGDDGTVRLWETGTGKLLSILRGHTGSVWGVALSADSRRLSTGAFDGTVRVWDVTSGTCLRTLVAQRRYERLDITDLTGITAAQRASLLALGAVERPLDRTLALASTPQSAVADQPARGEQQVAGSLPSQSTSFVGRSAELAAIARRLADPGCRLLTLLGPGGIGKTRLALAVAAAHIDAFPDGVAFMALASVGSPDQIVSAIGESLHLDFASQADPTAHLLGYLRERRMLLVLDNFEHLLASADLVSVILERAPHLTLLVTSRERLNLQAEWLFNVDGLAYPSNDPHEAALPQSLADLTEYSAVQLFVQRATQVQPRLPVSELDLRTIIQICQHVAGMPLAIELAAAGVRTLPLAEIERQLHANLDVLATSLRDVPTRHRSMRAVFDHSWRLLNEQERALFSHLAVFRGGWTAEAAVQVAGATIDVLTTLVDKSLVRVSSAATRSTGGRAVSDTAAEPRYTMLEPIREYALEQLVAWGEEEIVRHAHASYYLALAEAAAAQWDSPTAEVAIAQLDREYDNLRAALRWACDGGDHTIGLRLAEALWQFWRSYGYASEGRVWLEQLLALEDNPTDRTALAARQRGLHAAAWLASDQHEYAQAARLFEQSMALLRTLGEGESETDLMLNAARQARTEGDYQRATALFEHVLAWHRAQGYDIARGSITQQPALFAFGQVLRELGLVTREQGDFAQARALFEENLALHQIVGDRASVGFALIGLADVARDQGDAAGVHEYGEQALTILRELGVQWAIGFALNTLALGAYSEGDLTRALTLIRESEALFRGLQADASLAEVLITLGKIERARGNNAAAWQAMSEALRLAQAHGPRLMVAAALEGLASVVVAQEHAELAARLLAAAAPLRAQMGTPVWPVDQANLTNTLATARSALGADAFAAAWAEAQALPLEQILNTLPSAAAFSISAAPLDALPSTTNRPPPA